jgi:hypothetical protein
MTILIIQIHLAKKFLPAKFRIKYANMNTFKGSGYRKMRGVGSLATDRIWYGTVVIDVCSVFNGLVVFFATYFRFLLVKLN